MWLVCYVHVSSSLPARLLTEGPRLDSVIYNPTVYQEAYSTLQCPSDQPSTLLMCLSIYRNHWVQVHQTTDYSQHYKLAARVTLSALTVVTKQAMPSPHASNDAVFSVMWTTSVQNVWNKNALHAKDTKWESHIHGYKYKKCKIYIWNW